MKRHEAGLPAAEFARDLGVSTATFYTWRNKYAKMEPSHLRQFKRLEAENAELRTM